MNMIAVDDEVFALKDLEETIELALANGNVKIHGFLDPCEALEFAELNPIDIAFLDVEMVGMTGIELAQKLKNINGKMNIVFTTGYSQYAIDAFSVNASGYLLKPVTPKAVLKAMEQLRNPVDTKADTGLTVQTFGNFEVFYKNVPVHFYRSKAKEVFAYLVHKKGTRCTTRELASVVFEDREYDNSVQRQMQTIISSMIKSFSEMGLSDIIFKSFNGLSVNTEKISCDYFRFLNGDITAVNSYSGEYMSNYSWAEFMAGYLDSKIFGYGES